MKPSFYLDEHIPPVYAMELEKMGFTVLLATQSDRRGKFDDEQLTYAIEKKAVVITHNLRDFARLHKLVIASGGHHSGIIGISELDRHGRPRLASQSELHFGRVMPPKCCSMTRNLISWSPAAPSIIGVSQ